MNNSFAELEYALRYGLRYFVCNKRYVDDDVMLSD